MKKTRSKAALVLFGTAVSSGMAHGEPSALPEGDGRQQVEAICTACHSTRTILRSAGFDGADDWRRVISTMVSLTDEQASTITAYLAQHFPRDQSRAPTLIPGNTRIEITEWQTPTLGQRTRDPVEAPDGAIWWTGMWASLAGRLNPDTGEMTEYPLPPSARPHSIVPDAAGNIWYTGNSNGTIGLLDPKSGKVTEFETEAGDPHTATFHPNGKLYFTAQHAGMLGRLDPATGALTEIKTDRRPYGIQVGPDGFLWVAYNGTNKIGALHPDDMTVRYYEVPDERTRIRRLGLDSSGIIWFVNSSLGKIGRLDPKSGDVQQWDSPSGPTSHPYALAVIDDVVWYNESGMRPDALVRFDPATEQFQSWAVPSGVGIVRNMWVTKDNNLLIHQTSSNRVGLVKIRQ